MSTSAQRENPNQFHLPNMPSQWRSIPALAERLNAGASKPTFTEYSLRHYIRNAQRNGLASAVMRKGRKILVNEAAFIEWLGTRGTAE